MEKVIYKRHPQATLSTQNKDARTKSKGSALVTAILERRVQTVKLSEPSFVFYKSQKYTPPHWYIHSISQHLHPLGL